MPMKQCISVIIPVYNVVSFLPRCLESVCGQTYGNLEILLVDDGSTDGSGALCGRWAEKDARIRVIRKENGGVSSARNAGLKAASGELIGFVDADDQIDPEMYEKLVKLLEKEHADAVSCGYVDYPYGEGIPVPKGTKKVPPCGFAGAVTALFERNGYFTTVWNKLFLRRAVFGEEGPVLFDPAFDFGEDEVWLLKVLKRCGRIAFLPEALYFWMPREGSVTRFLKLSKSQLSLLKAKKYTLRLIPQEKKLLRLARGRIFNDCYLMKVRAYCTGDRESFRIISGTLAPFAGDWLKSPDPVLLRKYKVLLMELLMRLHAPAGFVQALCRIDAGALRKGKNFDQRDHTCF